MNSKFDKLTEAICQYYFSPDTQVIRIILAATAAHNLKGQPVWVMLIGPPGSMKTSIVQGLDGMSKVHLVDQVTPKSFISGQMQDPNKPASQSPSLLHRIGNDGILVMSDFSTVLAMNGDKREQVLADLRRIFDGQLSKEFGHTDNLESRNWSGRLTVFAACTPELDTHNRVSQNLGERFVTVRVPRPDGPAAAMAAMNQDVKAAKDAMKNEFQEILMGLPVTEPIVPHSIIVKIANLAEFTAIARTHVNRDSYKKEIVGVPTPEAPTRLSQQMLQLSKGSALLDHRSEVSDDDYALAVRVAFDTLPDEKRLVLRAVIDGKHPRETGLPASTISYATGDLEALGLLDKTTVANCVRLTPKATKLLTAAAVLAPETGQQAA